MDASKRNSEAKLQPASGGLARIFAKPDFEPDKFVDKRSSTGSVDELKTLRREVHSIQDENSVALKRNVFENYAQFISTAKEISILEGEMYQLSHLLTDQKSIMTSVLERSLFGDSMAADKESDQMAVRKDDNQRNLAFLLEKVEGCASVMEVSGRTLLHDGDVIEMDSESFAVIQKSHLFLLSDSLMITNVLQQRRGPMKYRYQTLYELDNLAIVNVKDTPLCKNAFKILMFPENRLFQADSQKEKRMWLDKLEAAKKKKSASDKERKEQQLLDHRPPSISAEQVVAQGVSAQDSVSADLDLLHADWLLELPEDLDVCIGQRDFEGAVDLIEKVNKHLEEAPKVPAVREYRSRIDHRVKQLMEVLMSELRGSPERSAHGGPRAARRAVTQLIRLGKSAQACELFLHNHMLIIRYNLAQIKSEGATVLHVRRLSDVFFGSMLDAGNEFLRAFANHNQCFASFVIWTRKELAEFLVIFRKQAFTSKTSFTTSTECVQIVRKQCDQLADLLGLELAFMLNSLVQSDLVSCIKRETEHQMEVVKRRCEEDHWRPMNFQNADRIGLFVKDLAQLGLKQANDFTYDVCFTALTSNMVDFIKSHLPFTDALLSVYEQELQPLVVAGVLQPVVMQLQHVVTSYTNPKYSREKATIVKNASFIMDHVVPLVKEKYFDVSGQELQTDVLETLFGSMVTH